MRARHVFKVIDSHTGGNPTRLVISGIPPLAGASVMAKMQCFRTRYDWIRTALTTEPRGGSLTSAVALVAPAHPDADVGVFFMEPYGYPPMCGSDTIGIVTTLIETGQIPPAGAEMTVRLDTPAGLVVATARLSAGEVKQVTFTNVPAFVAVSDATLQIPGVGAISVDVAYGGNFYAIVAAEQLDVELDTERPSAIAAVAEQVRLAANQALRVRHPVHDQISEITHVLVHSAAAAGGVDARSRSLFRPRFSTDPPAERVPPHESRRCSAKANSRSAAK